MAPSKRVHQFLVPLAPHGNAIYHECNVVVAAACAPEGEVIRGLVDEPARSPSQIYSAAPSLSMLAADFARRRPGMRNDASSLGRVTRVVRINEQVTKGTVLEPKETGRYKVGINDNADNERESLIFCGCVETMSPG